MPQNVRVAVVLLSLHLILSLLLFVPRVHVDLVLVLEHVAAVLGDGLEGVAAVLDGVGQVAPNSDSLSRCERDQGRKRDEEANPRLKKTAIIICDLECIGFSQGFASSLHLLS